jgi:hypothetical protein
MGENRLNAGGRKRKGVDRWGFDEGINLVADWY